METIKGQILDLTLEPGTRLDEQAVMKLCGLGRTPVREAISRLAATGLVVLQANKGAFVRGLDIAEVGKLFEAYAVSERLAASFCNFDDPGLVDDVIRMQRQHREAVRAKQFLEVSRWFASFRSRIAMSARNEYITDFCVRINDQMRRLSCLVYRVEALDDRNREAQMALIERQHSSIAEALRQADRDVLWQTLDSQIGEFRERIGRSIMRPRPTLEFTRFEATPDSVTSAAHRKQGSGDRASARRAKK